MKVENATGKLLALASKCETKEATLSMSIDLIEEIYSDIGSCDTCEYVKNCMILYHMNGNYCADYIKG